MSIRIAFTGGGTAGHVFPALSVYQLLQERSEEISFLWIGSKKGIEYSIVRDAGIPFISIPAGKLRRYFSFRNFFDIFRIITGFICAFIYFLRNRPDVLFSKGGYVTVPPVWAAGILGIPVISHESDMMPGLATRLNQRFSKTVCVAYKRTGDALSKRTKAHIEITGNPVREEIVRVEPEKALNELGLSSAVKQKPLVMVIGGSLGAMALNRLVADNLEWLLQRFTIVHQTGAANEHLYSPREGYCPRGFFKSNHLDLMAASELIICRAGASTLWEAAVLGKPMILIPLSTGASRGDQILNAQYFAQAGAAVVLGEEELGKLQETVTILLETPGMLQKMAGASASLVPGNAAEHIAEIVFTAAVEGKNKASAGLSTGEHNESP